MSLHRIKLMKSRPNKPPKHIKAPGRIALIKEARTLVDIGSVAVSFAQRGLLGKAASQRGKNSPPIIMFPGFASDDRYLWPLRRYLMSLGYQAEGWGLGTNLAGANLPHTLDDLHPRWDIEHTSKELREDYRGEGGVPYLCDKAIERVQQRIAELDSPVILLGWSLGGYVAREVARELDKDVKQVITFGSPVIGGPKYTSAAPIFKARGFNLDWIESEIERRNTKPIQQPITAIYSKSDGIVGWPASIDHNSPNVEHIEVDAAHLGMGFNRTVWKLVLEALDKHAD